MRIGRAAGVTDTGRRRLRNEDAFICEPPLFAVADGMGGARAGEVAARLAAAAMPSANAPPGVGWAGVAGCAPSGSSGEAGAPAESVMPTIFRR